MLLIVDVERTEEDVEVEEEKEEARMAKRMTRKKKVMNLEPMIQGDVEEAGVEDNIDVTAPDM